MAKGAVFTGEDKEGLRKRMCDACELSWKEKGYKKTNIKELCTRIGIAIGSFYSLYPTKEDLFCETMDVIQNRLKDQFFDILKNDPTKNGFTKALKELYREYDRTPFLYEINTEDFLSLRNKLPNEKLNKLQFDSVEFFKKAIDMANIKLKVNTELALGTLSALLSSIQSKEPLDKTCNHIKIFDFMLESLMNEMFEGRK